MKNILFSLLAAALFVGCANNTKQIGSVGGVQFYRVRSTSFSGPNITSLVTKDAEGEVKIQQTFAGTGLGATAISAVGQVGSSAILGLSFPKNVGDKISASGGGNNNTATASGGNSAAVNHNANSNSARSSSDSSARSSSSSDAHARSNSDSNATGGNATGGNSDATGGSGGNGGNGGNGGKSHPDSPGNGGTPGEGGQNGNGNGHGHNP